MNINLSPEAEIRVNELAMKHGGRITAETVVKDAKRKNSPLHKYFQWDVTKAAHAYWLDVARSIIRSVRIERRVEHRTVNVVAYVRDPANTGTKRPGYVALELAAKSDADSVSVLAYELGRMRDIMRRVEQIAQALGMDEDAARITEAIELMAGKAEMVGAA